MHTRARSLDVVVGVAFIKLLSNMVGSASFSTWSWRPLVEYWH